MSQSSSSSTMSILSPSRRRIAWLGNASGAELALARRWAGELADVVEPDPEALESGPSAAACGPTAVILAGRRPGCWDLRRATTLVRHWPLAPLVSLVTSLDEGRRRSGPALPGVEEMTWTDLPGRLAWWFAELGRGRPGSLGLPATMRREDRLLDAAARIHAVAERSGAGPRIAAAATRRIDVEGLADLLAAIGRPASVRSRGRPAVDVAADAVVWDVGAVSPDDLTWLRMITAHRPGLPVVLVESFPRADEGIVFRSPAAP